MKHLVIIAGIFFAAFHATAQVPMGAPNAKGAPSVPNMGHVYGKLIDSLGKPISDASVLLLQTKYDTATKKRRDILLKGLSTKANGEFSFFELPIFGPLKLKVSATGFRPYEQTVAFQMNMGGAQKPAAGQTPDISSIASAFDKDLGNITLKTDVQQLADVTVTAVSRPGVKLDIDKKTYNVEKDIVNAGGTALDVMKNVPSVQVDIDGNVKLRNSPPQIFIEGRPTTLSLDQIPADAIESVEVITNPSAKYDASGGNAGILNIILKRNRRTGYNGNLRAGVDKRGGINGGGDFNVRQGKINFTASGMVNQMRGRTTGTTYQKNLFLQPVEEYYQNSLNKTKGGFAFGRVGVDYFVTNRTTLSLNGIKVHGQFNPADESNADISKLYSSGTVKSYATRNSSGTREFNANGLQFGMKHLFPKEGEEITFDANYFSGKSGGNSLYVTDSMDAAHSIYANEQQRVLSDGTNTFFTAQTDYTKPLKNKAKIEAGLRASLRKLSNDNETWINRNNSAFEKIASANNDYNNNDNVYAAYVTFTSAIKDFGYQLGLRAESSDYTGTLLTTGEKFHNNYPISLFPSVFLSQKLKDNQTVQLNYSRRINRPNFFQLIPYTDRTDVLNITRGNPDLIPEFTNSLEASYSKTFKKSNNLLASVYYKNSNNLITRFQQKELDPVLEKEVLINTYINANSSYSAGAEFTSINYIQKWWDVTTNINVYNSKINTDNITGQSQKALWSWFGKINNNFKLPSNFIVQLSANYQSKTNLPVNQGGGGFGGGGPFGQAQSAAQGYIKAFYGVDVAIRKNFLKNNAASATLSFSDIFRTRRQEQYSESPLFIQDYTRLRDPQMIRLNLTYRFGKLDMSLFKRKNIKGMNEGMQGATEGMGQ